jgi:hypothetical protein
VACAALCESLGLRPGELADVPVIAAVWHGATEYTDQYYRDLLASGVDLGNPMLFAGSVPNVGSAHLTREFGILAAGSTVVGTRIAGIQAVALAHHRMVIGEWERALVVAGEEAHALGHRVALANAAQDMELSAGSVAILLERAPRQDASTNGRAPHGRYATTGSPCDRALHASASHVVGIPECGAASGLALMAWSTSVGSSEACAIATADPAGQTARAMWSTDAVIHPSFVRSGSR